jgi:DNA-binding transcriptional regulator LsrR (DeoR family)
MRICPHPLSINVARTNVNETTHTVPLIDKVAWLYYVDDLTQQEIADRLHLSRSKVGRLLQKARDLGIVEISLSESAIVHVKLERELENSFELAEAVVVDSADDEAQERRLMGRAAAHHLPRVLGKSFKLGLGMGRTVTEILPFVTPWQLTDGTIMGVAGGLSQPELTTNPYDISWRLSNLLGARVEHLYAPFVVENAAAREVLLQDRLTRQQLERAATCDVVVVGIGPLLDNGLLVRLGYCDVALIRQLREQGTVGDIMGRFFDIQGHPIANEMDERLIGLDLEQLKQIPEVIAVAGGHSKVKAILGALRTGSVDVLITTAYTAEKVLALNKN